MMIDTQRRRRRHRAEIRFFFPESRETFDPKVSSNMNVDNRNFIIQVSLLTEVRHFGLKGRRNTSNYRTVLRLLDLCHTSSSSSFSSLPVDAPAPPRHLLCTRRIRPASSVQFDTNFHQLQCTGWKEKFARLNSTPSIRWKY